MSEIIIVSAPPSRASGGRPILLLFSPPLPLSGPVSFLKCTHAHAYIRGAVCIYMDLFSIYARGRPIPTGRFPDVIACRTAGRLNPKTISAFSFLPVIVVRPKGPTLRASRRPPKDLINEFLGRYDFETSKSCQI